MFLVGVDGTIQTIDKLGLLGPSISQNLATEGAQLSEGVGVNQSKLGVKFEIDSKQTTNKF